MDLNTSSSAPRKVRFTPKPPRRRKLILAEPEIDMADDDDKDSDGAADDKSQQALIRRVNDNIARRSPQVEKKAPVQVAFSQAAGSATTLRTFGKAKEKNSGSSSKGSAASDEKILVTSSSTGRDGNKGYSRDDMDVWYENKRKDYKEPWDYKHSYYPTTLPLRRPYCGDPELLDEAEFGLNGMHLEYDERSINPASELGLLERSDQTQIIFLQLPPKLPLDKLSGAKGGGPSVERKGASAAVKGKETVNQAEWTASRPCSLRDLPQGHMGKMLVYKSGAIKWKIGEIVYDVFPGENCIFPQDVVAINTAEKNCCVLGEVSKRAVVSPDVDSLLEN